MATSTTSNVILVKNGRVYDHDGDVHLPAACDLLIVDGLIAAVRPGMAGALAHGERLAELGARAIDQTIDATDKLLMPGFVNAHYHSHDVLLKGCFETIPLELWLLSALPPSYPKRSTAEIRARTLLGALECLRSGMTTVQDLATIYPFDEEHLEAVLQAYEDIGIRCVFALQFTDMTGAKSIPFWEDVVPQEHRSALAGSVEPFQGVDLPKLLRSIVSSQRRRHPRITLALGPTSPERCTTGLLRQVAELSDAEKLPVYTHLYESRAMTLIARQTHKAQDAGSLVEYLKRVGLLTPRMNLAHSVWMLPSEIDSIAEAGAHVVLNPVGNLKTRSGVAPIRTYLSPVLRRLPTRSGRRRSAARAPPDWRDKSARCGRAWPPICQSSISPIPPSFRSTASRARSCSRNPGAPSKPSLSPAALSSRTASAPPSTSTRCARKSPSS
jgi:5-methylthioadenosine/S-adenosylhomocysteine deaminase